MDIDLVLRPTQILKVMEKVGNPTTIICKAKAVCARRSGALGGNDRLDFLREELERRETAA